MDLPERKPEIQPDIIAFRKDPEKSIIENLKDYSEVLKERFTDVNADSICKYFEDEENILKLNLSLDATK